MTIDVDVLMEKLQDAAAHKGLGAAIADILIQFIETLPTLDVVERSSFEAIGQKYAQIQDKLIRGELVPVVRCKECKFRFRNNGHDKNGCPITDSDIWMDDDGFCSYGERKDYENN